MTMLNIRLAALSALILLAPLTSVATAQTDGSVVQALATEVAALREEVRALRRSVGTSRVDVSNQVEQAMSAMMASNGSPGVSSPSIAANDASAASVANMHRNAGHIPAELALFVPDDAQAMSMHRDKLGRMVTDRPGPFALFASFRNDAELNNALRRVKDVPEHEVRAASVAGTYVIYFGPYAMLSEARHRSALLSRQMDVTVRVRDRSGQLVE